MGWLIAAGHIIGSFIASIMLAVVLQWVSNKVNLWNTKSSEQEASIDLGIPLSQMGNEEHIETLLSYAAKKASSESFANRISDFCGIIAKGVSALSFVVQACFIGGAAYTAVTESPQSAVIAWATLIVIVIAWSFNIMLAIACKILTGKLPGQAKAMRQIVSQQIEQRSGSYTSSLSPE